MDNPGGTWSTIIIIFLLAINAFVNFSKESILEISTSKLEDDAEDGNEKAKLILKMTENENQFLSLTRLASLLPSFIAISLAINLYTKKICDIFDAKMPTEIAQLLSILIIVLLFSVFILSICELVPKRISIKYSNSIGYFTCKPLNIILKLLIPFNYILDKISKVIAAIFGIDISAESDNATEDDIRDMLDDANENGNIEESEVDMINNIFEFDDRTVGEIMTHRIDMTAVEINSPIAETVDLAISDGYSRMPVYEETIDNIKGIIYAKDLLSLIGENDFSKRKIEDFIRPVSFIPESNSCRETFLQFQQKKIQAAIVIDEYGGTAGLVSMEDLIESVMGNIQDEYDNETNEIEKIDNDNFDFEGTVLLDDISDLLGIDFPEDKDYDTLSGLIMDILGRIPEENEKPVCVYENVEFTVESVEEHRIAKVHAKIIQKDN